MAKRFFSHNKAYVCTETHLLDDLQVLMDELDEAAAGDCGDPNCGGMACDACAEAYLAIDKFLQSLVEVDKKSLPAPRSVVFECEEENMSYSLNSDCGICTKKDKCTDRHFLEGAISGIHSVWPAEKGHLGSGTVELKCQRFEKKEE